MQAILGVVNYYRWFLPAFVRQLAPLHAAVSEAGKSKEITWTASCDDAFAAAKASLAADTLIHHPDLSAPTALTVDASDVTIGAELAQQDESGKWQPLAFFSLKLNRAQHNYSAFDGASGHV